MKLAVGSLERDIIVPAPPRQFRNKIHDDLQYKCWEQLGLETMICVLTECMVL